MPISDFKVTSCRDARGGCLLLPPPMSASDRGVEDYDKDQDSQIESGSCRPAVAAISTATGRR